MLTVYCSHVRQSWKHDPLIDGETKSVSCSGDGTVPYDWSLQHAQEWAAGQCDVIVDAEIDGANHREILADERFHAVVLDYFTN